MSIWKKKCFKKKKKEEPVVEEETDESKNKTSSKTEDDSKVSDEVIPPPPLEGEMATYFHIGGWAKECLITGYKIGAWHFDCTTQLTDKLGIYSFGNGKPNYYGVSGGVGLREKLGIFHMCQAYHTNAYVGAFGVRSTVVGCLANAMLRGTYGPHDEPEVTLDLHTGLERSPIKMDVIVPILKSPKLMGYVVLQPLQNYLLGYRAVYDFDNMGFDMHALCVGFNNGSSELSLKLENFKELRGSIFQRIGERWAVALKANIYGENEKQFAIGGQYKIQDNALLKAKVRDDGFVGMVYQVNVSENIGIMYHVGLEVGSPINGDHKVGISWSIKG
ncbi:voltage-dependent anion-selective channel [Drosophila virilis]|uniref:Voltage-dependent anion-selective channel protein 3 n=1 Tax=Drosophila virilis TaxID=7244 RepID=B4LS70_DROVI|nr:uncharacterized protein LOC6628772 [Drosophila virilis]EDW64756.1 uncharacterized protein Dvir_GJ17636 [Drosophila virilis]